MQCLYGNTVKTQTLLELEIINDNSVTAAIYKLVIIFAMLKRQNIIAFVR